MKNRDDIEKVINSRTGVIYLTKDNIAIKVLKDPTNVIEEYSIINELYNRYTEKTINGWRYKTIKPLKVEQEKIYMERAEGVPLKLAAKKNTNLLVHAGIWLGFFHNIDNTKGDECILFLDFGLGDVIVEENKKIVTALDPGRKFGATGLPESDILKVLIPIINESLKQKQSPREKIDIFLKGYYSVADKDFCIKSYYASLPHAFTKFKRTYKRNKSRPLYLLSILYLKFLEVYIKILLKKTQC